MTPGAHRPPMHAASAVRGTARAVQLNPGAEQSRVLGRDATVLA
jgi:hypothetical protein